MMHFPITNTRNLKYKSISFVFSVVVLLFSSLISYAQEPTLLGLHGVPKYSQILESTGAKIVREGVTDYKIKQSIDQSDFTFLHQMMELDSLGYEKIIYLIHNEDTTVGITEIAWQRIPYGDDRIEVFEYLDIFLSLVGPYIQWIQINQEPMGITQYDTEQYSLNDILDWWRSLAQFIDNKREQYPNTLGHLKILSPSISSMVPKPEILPVVDSIIAFGENYCDAISLHIYPETVAHGKEVIDYFRSKTNHPLACTEFSQAKAGEYTEWFDMENTVWTNSSSVFFGLTNKEVISSSYSNPMDTTEWKAFISTAPYTEHFIEEMYAVMDSNCFEFACYACLWQYGEAVFDWSALITNKTVTHYPFPNNPFYSEYVGLSSSLNSGNYQSQCQASAISNTPNNESAITISPNPFKSEINIEFGKYIEDATLKLYNQTGKEILNLDNINGNSYTIRRSDLEAGIYFIHVIYNDGLFMSSKIVKSP